MMTTPGRCVLRKQPRKQPAGFRRGSRTMGSFLGAALFAIFTIKTCAPRLFEMPTFRHG